MQIFEFKYSEPHRTKPTLKVQQKYYVVANNLIDATNKFNSVVIRDGNSSVVKTEMFKDIPHGVFKRVRKPKGDKNARNT
jgi:hypothetical protein